MRRGEPLDEYIEKIVLGYLSDPETRQRLAAMPHRGERVNVEEPHTRRAALGARLDDLAAMFAAGDIDGNQLRRGTNELRTQLAGVNQVLGELSRRSPVADILGADDPVELAQAVDGHERQSAARNLHCHRAADAARHPHLRLRAHRHRLQGVNGGRRLA